MSIDVELTTVEKELPTVNSTSDLRHFINGFSGGSYDESVRMAFDWMNNVNADPRDGRDIELVGYFKQEHKGKSILVSYKTKPKGLKNA